MTTCPQIQPTLGGIPIKIDSVIAKRTRIELVEEVIRRKEVGLLKRNALLRKIIAPRFSLACFGSQRQR